MSGMDLKDTTDAEIRVTCGYCSGQPAVYVLVMWWSTMRERTVDLACEDCGNEFRQQAGRLGLLHLYAVDLSTPTWEVPYVHA